MIEDWFHARKVYFFYILLVSCHKSLYNKYNKGNSHNISHCDRGEVQIWMNLWHLIGIREIGAKSWISRNTDRYRNI